MSNFDRDVNFWPRMSKLQRVADKFVIPVSKTGASYNFHDLVHFGQKNFSGKGVIFSANNVVRAILSSTFTIGIHKNGIKTKKMLTKKHKMFFQNF